MIRVDLSCTTRNLTYDDIVACADIKKILSNVKPLNVKL